MEPETLTRMMMLTKRTGARSHNLSRILERDVNTMSQDEMLVDEDTNKIADGSKGKGKGKEKATDLKGSVDDDNLPWCATFYQQRQL
jgi:hypothetical protein